MSEVTLYNLNLDDLLPSFTDFSKLMRLIRLFPGIRITVFIPINSRCWGENRNDIRKHKRWCRTVRGLPSQNVEFAVHGFYHDGLGKQPEFLALLKKEAIERLLACERALTEVGIPYVKGFRPPQWRMSEGTALALKELNYLFLADAPGYLPVHEDIGIPRIFMNADIRIGKWSFVARKDRHLLPDPDKLYLHRGHFVSRHSNNLNNDDNFRNIVKRIRSVKPEFVFMSELAKFSPEERTALGIWGGGRAACEGR